MTAVLRDLYVALEEHRVAIDEAVANAKTDIERAAGGRIRKELSALSSHTYKAYANLLASVSLAK